MDPIVTRNDFLKALEEAHGPISFQFLPIQDASVYTLLTARIMIKQEDLDNSEVYQKALESVAFYCDGCETWNTFHALSRVDGSERCCECDPMHWDTGMSDER